MKKLAILLLIFFSMVVTAQSVSKEYSKDIALYRAKFFLIKNVIGSTEQYKKLYIDPLAASKSTEITSIYYESENKKGLLLGFFDDFWDNGGSGIGFKGYAYKNIDFDNALSLLNKIEKIIDEEKKYLNADDNENNIFFQEDDIIIVIYRKGPLAGRIRILWDGYDGEWENTAFRRTKRRFEKALK